MVDLLTDLMHLSQDTQTDFTDLLRTAQRRYCQEHLLARLSLDPHRPTRAGSSARRRPPI